MKSIWTYALALGTMMAPTASLAGETIMPTDFFPDIQLELPAARARTCNLNANLFSLNPSARLPDVRPLGLSDQIPLVNGKLVQAGAASTPLFPNINVGGDAYIKNTEQDLGDNDAQNVTYRISYEHLTPYVYGGVGYKFDNKFDYLRPQFEQMGVGTVFHLLNNWSVYVDGRYVFGGDTQNSALARAGLRFSF